MSKRTVLSIILLFMLLLPSRAVLKERDIAGTLAMLRIELTNYHTSLERQSGYLKEQQQQVMKQLVDALNKSQQNALMLYSQKNGYVFDLTYACHEATEQYREFKQNALPFRTFVNNADIEISRYDSLINDLSTMYTAALSTRSKIDRNVCLTLAVNIRHTLNDNRTQIQQYIDLYNTTESRLKYLNDYANKRYSDIQNSIFSNRGENYFSILRQIKEQVKETSQTIIDKYKPQQKYHSDWDSRIIIGLLVMIFIVGFLASGINYITIGLAITWLMKREKAEQAINWVLGSKRGAEARDYFKDKRWCIIMTATVITFALILGIVRLAWTQNFIIMACSLRMVVGCNTFLTAHSPQQRADKVWLSHLCTHHLSMLYGHHFPHNSCPKRLCKPHLSAHFAGCYRMAMAGDKPLQQETSRQRCRLCLYFFSCLSGERRSLSGRIHAACSRASDMVDDAADLYSHHYLFVEHAEKVCQ